MNDLPEDYEDWLRPKRADGQAGQPGGASSPHSEPNPPGHADANAPEPDRAAQLTPPPAAKPGSGAADSTAVVPDQTAVIPDPTQVAPSESRQIPVIPAPPEAVTPHTPAASIPAPPVPPSTPGVAPPPVAPAMVPAVAPAVLPTRQPATVPPKKAVGKRRRKKGRARRVIRWVLVVAIVYVLAVVSVFALSVNRIDAMPATSTGSGAGMNVLMIGSDSRAGLTEEQQNQLTTGSVEGNRTDTIMLLHIPVFGTPTLVSIPRDSWVPIPGYGNDKINAAYALGGPELLISTVEQATGLRIDNFVEIGFAGIANTTDALGGVRLCPTQAYNDELSGLNVQAGCQLMDGPTSLAYVRMRYADPKGDLGRIERQQEYISAVVKRGLNPLTWLLPWRAFGAAHAAGSALTVSRGTGIFDLGRIGVALGMISMGWGTSTTVPTVPGDLAVDGQLALQWNSAEAQQLFDSLS